MRARRRKIPAGTPLILANVAGNLEAFRWQRDFQMQMEMKLRQTVEPQVEQAIQMLETDLRGLWPQLSDMLQTLFERELANSCPGTF